MKKLSLYIQLY